MQYFKIIIQAHSLVNSQLIPNSHINALSEETIEKEIFSLYACLNEAQKI